MTEESTVEETTRLHCNECLGERNHSVLKKYEYRDADDECGIWMDYEYLTLKCMGCDHMSFQTRRLFSEDINPIGYDPSGDIVYEVPWVEEQFPAALYRRKPDWFEDLADDVMKNIFQELYASLQSKSHFLATFGARTVIDRLIVRTVGDQGNFESGIEKLLSEGIISTTEKGVIDPVIEAGNAAAHRGYAASSELLDTIMDTIEGLIYRVLVLPDKSKSLKEAVPARRKAPTAEKHVPVKAITIKDKISNAPKPIGVLFNAVKDYIMRNYSGTKLFHKKHYVGFKRRQYFASITIKPQLGHIVLYLNLDVDVHDVEIKDGFTRDVRALGHHGVGGFEVIIKNVEDIQKVEDYIKLSYDNS